MERVFLCGKIFGSKHHEFKVLTQNLFMGHSMEVRDLIHVNLRCSRES